MSTGIEVGIRVISEAERTVVALSGEVDDYSVVHLREVLREVIEQARPPTLIIDLDEVHFIDSTGLGMFVGVLKRQRDHGGGLVLANPQPAIEKVFDITGLTKVFEVESDRRR
jgi:anti-sigma B factor antagonist